MITVQMLGHFSMSKGNAVLAFRGTNSIQVMKLLQYLLIYRFASASLDDIFRMLWPDKSCSDPMNALKALVHRLRCMLDQSGIAAGKNCIAYIHGSYQWNDDLPVRVDIEEFEKYWNEAQKSGIPDQCLKLYKSAISLYKGPFLQDMAGEDWVTPLSEYYQHIYTECVLRAAQIYRKSNDYQNIVMLCSQAVLKNPYEESIYECILKAFIRLNRKEKAMEYFNVLSQKFTEDLGIELSPNINSLYGEILKLETDSEQNIKEIACELKKSSCEKGALYCDFEVFKSIFRLKLRERQKEHLMLCLITLAPNPIEPGNNGRSLTSTADTLIMNLRKGDVVSKISRRQYIVMISNKRDTLRNDNEAAVPDYAGKVFKRLVSQLQSADGSEDWSVKFEIYEGHAESDKAMNCITAEFEIFPRCNGNITNEVYD